MNGKTMMTLKLVGAGMVIGMALYAGGEMMVKSCTGCGKSGVKRKLSDAARTVGDVMDNISGMLR